MKVTLNIDVVEIVNDEQHASVHRFIVGFLCVTGKREENGNVHIWIWKNFFFFFLKDFGKFLFRELYEIT